MYFITKKITAVSIGLALASNFASANPPPSTILELHPQTFYLVTLEYVETVEDIDVYTPIEETPEESRNICIVKPSACYKPRYYPDPPGSQMEK